MPVEFHNYSIEVQEAMSDAVISFLYEAGNELMSQAQRRTRRRSGKTAGAWQCVVDEAAQKATVGNTEENAIWEEMGTGEYALEGNGRRGGWYYVDDEGKGHFTFGKKPVRMLYNAFVENKAKIIRRAEEIFRGRLG